MQLTKVSERALQAMSRQSPSRGQPKTMLQGRRGRPGTGVGQMVPGAVGGAPLGGRRVAEVAGGLIAQGSSDHISAEKAGAVEFCRTFQPAREKKTSRTQ